MYICCHKIMCTHSLRKLVLEEATIRLLQRRLGRVTFQYVTLTRCPEIKSRLGLLQPIHFLFFYSLLNPGLNSYPNHNPYRVKLQRQLGDVRVRRLEDRSSRDFSEQKCCVTFRAHSCASRASAQPMMLWDSKSSLTYYIKQGVIYHAVFSSF